jgi:hypothetical protein
MWRLFWPRKLLYLEDFLFARDREILFLYVHNVEHGELYNLCLQSFFIYLVLKMLCGARIAYLGANILHL